MLKCQFVAFRTIVIVQRLHRHSGLSVVHQSAALSVALVPILFFVEGILRRFSVSVPAKGKNVYSYTILILTQTYVTTAPPFRLGELVGTAGPVVVLMLFVGVSDFVGDPFDVGVEFRFAVTVVVEELLIAAELRTFIDVRLLLALDGGGG